MVNHNRIQDLINDMAVVLEMKQMEDADYLWEGSREDAREMVMYSSPDEMTSVITELYNLIECMEHELQEDNEEEDEDPNMPECDDDLAYRENMAADSGDESSKAAYMKYYSSMGMEGDY